MRLPLYRTSCILLASIGLMACQSALRFTQASTSGVSLRRAHTHLALHEQLQHVVRSWIGIPYCRGGATNSCVDCSGFVQQVFAALGIPLPRTSAEQARLGYAVAEPLAPGDLVIVSVSDRVRHVAIYLGHGQVAHASGRRGVVIEPLQALLHIGPHLSFRRILPAD